MASSQESAFAAIDRLRSGDFAAACAIVDAARGRAAVGDPFLVAAGLHLGRIAAPYASDVDAAALWHAVARTGSDDAIAFFGGAYAATVGESVAACEILSTALRGGASLAASLETIVIAAEVGDGALRARALAKLERIATDASPGLRGLCDHAAALAERSGGHADRAHAHATRARVAYGRAGWHYYAARADELCGNERAASRVYARLGATHDLERLAAAVGGRRTGTAGELSPREHEVATLVAQGLANKEIAATLNISMKTVEKNITALYAKLGVTKRVQLAQSVNQATAALASATGNIHEPLTPFIGRSEEIADLRERVNGNRLITLVGAGGSGKSRLAVELARRERARYPAGAWFVDLAALNDAAAVLPAIAGTIGMPRDSSRSLEAALTTWLAQRDLLIVLDNCEHVLTGLARIVRTLLEAAPNVRIVATSRQRIGVFGEMLRVSARCAAATGWRSFSIARPPPARP